MQSQHMHIKFVCDLCKFSSKKRENLKKHYLNIHTKILTNPLAYRQLPEGSDTKLCEKCDFITLEEEDLERHMEREHIDIMDRHKVRTISFFVKVICSLLNFPSIVIILESKVKLILPTYTMMKLSY